MDPEHRAELLRLVKGSPQPQVWISGFAERMGVSDAEAAAMVDELLAEGALRRDGERLIVVEPAAFEGDERPIP
jgi:DNA-binding IclR family transcriptional regulator